MFRTAPHKRRPTRTSSLTSRPSARPSAATLLFSSLPLVTAVALPGKSYSFGVTLLMMYSAMSPR